MTRVIDVFRRSLALAKFARDHAALSDGHREEIATLERDLAALAAAPPASDEGGSRDWDCEPVRITNMLPKPHTRGLVVNRPTPQLTFHGRLFQASMWREYATTWYGRQFNGDWSSAQYQPDAIRQFKPWNKTCGTATMTIRTGARDELGRIDEDLMSETDEARLERMRACIGSSPVFQISRSDAEWLLAQLRDRDARIAEVERERDFARQEHDKIVRADTKEWRKQHDRAEALRAQVETLRSASEPFKNHATYLAKSLPQCIIDDSFTPVYGYERISGDEPEWCHALTLADFLTLVSALQSLSAKEPGR